MQLNATDEINIQLERTGYNLNERFVARFFGVGVETVRGWRKTGRGPRCRKIGGRVVRYCLADLVAWAEAQPTRGLRA